MPAKPPTDTSQQTAAERIAQALKRHRVDVIFGQSLPSAVLLAAEDAGIRQVVYRTENAGGAMADAYARLSHKIGVVAAQNGPAATLLVPPLAEALKASIPLVALVQEVARPTRDRNAFQELDHTALFQGCTKWVRTVDDPGRVEDYVDLAFTKAATGRPGPVALLLPADMLNEHGPAAAHPRSASLGVWPMDRVVADPAAIDQAADLLAGADHPLVIAGGGVHGAGACDLVAALQDEAALPVAYTMMGKGVVDDRHPLTVGLVGNVMGEMSIGKLSRPLLDSADRILLVGTRTNQNGTDSWSLFPPRADILHLDIDGHEVGRTYEPAVRLVGDAKLTLEALLQRLGQHDLGRRQAGRASLEAAIAQTRSAWAEATLALRTSDAQPIRPERVMAEVQSVLTADTAVVADASYSSVWINAYLGSFAPGQRFVTPRGLAGLGWGYPMALGAKVARPDAPVICVVGDGGFGHCWSELETARRTGTAVVLIVLNNSVLGYQKDAETVKFGRYTSACHFEPVDHAAIAKACGVAAHRITDPADLAPALRAALAANQSVLLDVVTDPDAYPPLTMYDARPGP